ncbi:glycosyltransferase [Rhizobium sp. CNPSo 3490]|uniref:glycosyltransferase family 4 protein n=1 Tax=Rhizobium sp. CNPSo 3490 TaxID=3021407 RepID=UPI00254D6E26|nr:glycosyltransferase [Rhizobium sp. CNPSo 3490]MDK4734479.1 glycosyltransferase [Rhizobium sp. CNPSo 3490]
MMHPSLSDVHGFAANASRFPGGGTPSIDRVVVIDDYSVARGGATGLAVLSAKLFRGLDIPVTYICGDDAANAELAALGVSMVGLNSRDLLSADRAKAFVTGIHNGAATRMVANWIAAEDTAKTVYHVHGWHQILSPALFRALAPVAGRCLVHAHDFFTACPNGAFFDYQAQEICLRRPLGAGCIATACDKRSYSHKLWRVARGSNILRLLKAQADFGRIILLHEKMASFLVGAGYRPDRLTTIRNPVAPLSKQRIEAEANDEFVFIGRLDEEKGVEDAVAATRRAGARLCVIGDGPLRGLVEASGDHVRTVGWQSHAEIGTTIRKARALLMPSRYPEPFGLVAIEAARSGLPVIMSRNAFLAEEMEQAGMAFACDTGDEIVFADALMRFSQMPRHEIRAMSERAFLMSPDLASTHEQWRDALLAEYCRLLSTNAVPELTDGVATQGAFL